MKDWSKIESFSTLSNHVIHKRRPRLRKISRVLDRRPALTHQIRLTNGG